LFVLSRFVGAQQSIFSIPFMQDTASNHGYTDFLSFQILYHMPSVTIFKTSYPLPTLVNQSQEADQPILISLLCQETIIHVHPSPLPSPPLFPRAARVFGI
jgi:heme oxygenase